MAVELYGGAWSDLEDWARRCRPEGCVVCASGHPFGIIGEFAHSWVTTDPEVAVNGYVLRDLKGACGRAVRALRLPRFDGQGPPITRWHRALRQLDHPLPAKTVEPSWRPWEAIGRVG
jgi:hypothetical protein